MKILYYSPHPELNLTDLAGYGTHMREMINAFKSLGNDVLPVIMGGTEPKAVMPSANSSGKQFLKQILPGIIKRTVKDFLLLQNDRKAGQLLEQKMMEFKPDLIYERANYLNISGVEMAKKYGVKHFLEVNAPYVDETKEFSNAPTMFYRTALKREKQQILGTEMAMFVSSPLRNYFLQKMPGLKAEKTMVTPNCINPDKINNSTSEGNKVKDKYHLNGNTVIGFVGSIFPFHGVELLIGAFDSLYKSFPNTKLLIIGGGQLLEKLKEQAKSLASKENIIFTGSVKHDKVFSCIQAMDITVLAKTNWYCSPIKLLEYGAMGKATIAPDTESVMDIMTNEADGLLVNPDVASIEKAMRLYVEKPELRNVYAQTFRNKILTNFTWTLCAQRVLAAYK